MTQQGKSTEPDFLWGVATSSYQIEGAAQADGRGLSIWDTFSRVPGAIADGSNGDVACDHYHRLEEDIALMAELGVDAYRFSIAWPRILPNGTGAVNDEGIAFYQRLLDELERYNIAAYATLYHWDLPEALEGGWTSRATAHAFAEYAGVVTEALGERVTAWATLNEPWCSSYLGYGAGVHAPGVQDMAAAFAAAHHLNLAHGLGVTAMRAAGATNVGVVLNLAPVHSVGDGMEEARETEDVWRNDIWLDPIIDGAYGERVSAIADRDGDGLPVQEGDLEQIAQPLDWLGINYYHDLFVPKPPPGPRTDIGWPITPEGIYDVIDSTARRSDLPIYITENGGAFLEDINDQERVAYLDAHIGHVLRAKDDGIDIRGYFEWSLMDNFEWAEGYRKRFGLVHIDYETLTRTPRTSYHWYKELIQRQR